MRAELVDRAHLRGRDCVCCVGAGRTGSGARERKGHWDFARGRGYFLETIRTRPKNALYDKDNEAKTKLRTGEATAELVQQEIARAKGAGVDVQVLALGDLSYPKGESMNCFNKYWGRFKEKILPVLGNHDTMTKDGQAYFD